MLVKYFKKNTFIFSINIKNIKNENMTEKKNQVKLVKPLKKNIKKY